MSTDNLQNNGHPDPGSLRHLSVGNPLNLDGAGVNTVWRVASGRIDVFALLERDGVPVGNRFFVMSAGPGDLLFAATGPLGHVTAGGVTCRLRAFAGSGATLTPVDALNDIATDQAGAVDTWLTAICAAVTRAHLDPVSGGIAVARGDEIIFAAGATIKSAHGVVWVKAAEGCITAFGARRDTPEMELPHLPLAAGAWIGALEAGRLQAIDTTAVLEGGDWREALSTFHVTALTVLTDNLLSAVALEEERVNASTAQSRRALTAAVSALSNVLTAGEQEAVLFQEEDALTACCREVAKALDIKMVAKALPKAPLPANLIERIVRQSGMPAREVTLYGAWWQTELGPLIGIVRETGEPVALIPDQNSRYTLFDPATGSRALIDEDAATRLSPTAYTLYAPLPDRPLHVWDLVRFGLSPSRTDLLMILALTLAGALLALGVPVATGILVDDLIPSHLKPQLFELAAVLVIVTVTQAVISIASDIAQLRVFTRAGTRLQTAIVDRALRLPNAVLGKFTSSDLAQRVMIIDALRAAFGGVILDSLLLGVFSLVSLGYLVIVAPLAALTAILLFTLYMTAAVWAGKSQVASTTTSVEASTKASQLAIEFIGNIPQLRAAGAEERAYARWAAFYAKARTFSLRSNMIANRFSAFTAGYQIFSLAAFFAALQALRTPEQSTGDVLILIATFAQFLGTTAGLGKALQTIFQITPNFRRAQVLFKAVPEVDATKTDPGALSGRIEISHVTFGYSEDAPPVLNDISLTIEAGQMVAFVGASGCGKSTMMKLLLGLIVPQSGSIYYDGHDLNIVDVRAVRRQIGVVLQEGKLMSGSIAENILGVVGGTMDDAWSAARRAGFAEDVENMPMGMHTMLTDGATTLSGGQVQRLLIARALVGTPRVLFLDEATSALDNRTQATVTRSLEQMAGTRIVIAHRLSTIEHADKIYVFEAGRIVQAGTYQDIVNIPGLFADLVRRQKVN